MINDCREEKKTDEATTKDEKREKVEESSSRVECVLREREREKIGRTGRI